MTDLEIVKKCAEKMGYESALAGWKVGQESTYDSVEILSENGWEDYDPLHDDAQAMALVKKFNLSIMKLNNWLVNDAPNQKDSTINKDLNRAICECVARMP